MRRLEEFIFSTLGPLVANAVHPVVIPQEATYPCIRYATVSAIARELDVRIERTRSLSGADRHLRRGIRAPCERLRESVVAAMREVFPLENILVSEFEAFEIEPKLFPAECSTYSTAEQEGSA